MPVAAPEALEKAFAGVYMAIRILFGENVEHHGDFRQIAGPDKLSGQPAAMPIVLLGRQLRIQATPDFAAISGQREAFSGMHRGPNC